MPSNFYNSKYGNFEKLNKLNYLRWRDDITGVLMSMEAYEALTEQPPPNGNTAAARAATAAYTTRRAKAVTAIRLSVTNEIRTLFEGNQNPVELWDILKKQFDSTASQAGRTKLNMEFYSIRPETNESITAYTARLKHYRQPLHGTEEEIPDRPHQPHIRYYTGLFQDGHTHHQTSAGRGAYAGQHHRRTGSV